MDEQRLLPLTPEALASGSDYVGISLADCQLVQRHLDGIALENSLLTKVRGAGVSWSNLRLSEVALRDCDFANAIWEKVHGVWLELSKCRLTGWNVAEGVFRNAQFIGCKANLAIFQGVALTECSFQNCNLIEADFQAAKLKNVTFRRCDLRGARFVAASLTAVDFRASHLAGIHLDAERLRGNLFDPAQLVDLAGMLGLVVQEVEEDSERQGE